MSRDLEVACEAARAGAAELSKRFVSSGPRIAAETKSTRRDLVTAADRAAEAAVLGVLRRAFPDDVIVAEESAAETAPGRRTWIVDPLDGTVNYAHGMPLFCVSVGLVVDGSPRVGALVAPALGESYEGERGAGARLNGVPIRVSATPELADAVLATGFAYDVDRIPDPNFDNFERVVRSARGIRRLGSAALDLAWVACGRLDGFWELHLHPWDVAAAAVLLQEAGGRLTDMTGGGDWLWGEHLAASNGRFHDELLARLARPSYARKSENGPRGAVP
jgi:myo-inositol-1(or 4)-monophosphatase